MACVEATDREELLQTIREHLNAAGGQASGEAAAWLERVRALQPYDFAELLRELHPYEQLALIPLLPRDYAAATLEYLEPVEQYHLLHQFSPDVGSELLLEMSSDVVVDLLLAVHPNQAAKLLGWLPAEYREQIDRLMTFPPNSAGSLAAVDYVAARENWTVDQTLRHIRKVAREAETLSYVYVLDARGRLTGVVSMREIFLADPNARLGDFANRDVIAAYALDDQEEAARLLSKYDFVALPVVDDEDRLVGIITVDDVVDVIRDEASEDIQKLGGSQPLTESYFRTPIPTLFRKRVGWLLVLFIAEAYTTTVLNHFKPLISMDATLSIFIPLLVGTGGNTGSQTVATLVRALGVHEVAFRDLFRVVAREAATGVMLGLAMGAAGLVRALIVGVGPSLGVVVALSALFIVIWASLVGAFLPLVLHRLGVDPAVVSGPFIATLVDGTGLFIYFSVARMMLGLH